MEKSSNQQAWSVSDNQYIPVATNSLDNQLPTGVYTIKVPMMGPTCLEKIKDEFHFGYKLYGHNYPLVERVIKSYIHTDGNLGILLNGVKGTGKSVTAELICNKAADDLGMPVVLVNSQISNLSEFLANIHQDIVVFIDEFEKVFSSTDEYGESYDKTQHVLTIMDGALKSKYRRLFVFTTNNKYINDNLLQRPGRLRYVVEYKDLTKAVIEEIIDDMLVYKERRQECIDFISSLKLITVDIVKAIIQEVNIHNEDPKDFKDIFNVEEKGHVYNLYKGEIDLTKDYMTKPLHEGVELHLSSLARKGPRNEGLRINDEYIGLIKNVTGKVITYVDDKGNEQKFTYEEVKAFHHAYAF